MTNNEIMELVVPIPDYTSRFLSILARETGLDENDIVCFFLRREAYHASCGEIRENDLPRNVCAAQPE